MKYFLVQVTTRGIHFAFIAIEHRSLVVGTLSWG